MIQIAIPKLTFRLHDNPLLNKTDCILVILEKERFPFLKENLSKTDNIQWNYHQFNLLLQTLIGLPSFNVIVVPKNKLKSVLKILDEYNIVTDYTNDPAFSFFDSCLNECSNVKILSTFTLIDWRLEKHALKKEYWNNAKSYTKLDPIKKHILENISKPKNYPFKGKVTLDDIGLTKYKLDLKDLLKKVQKEMITLGLNVHVFKSGDANILKFAKEKIKLISSDSWYKPNTSVGLDYGYKLKDKDSNTSQLSPFLSIGALSVKTFWSLLGESNTKMGSAKDQLLFRESFHCVSRMENFFNDKNILINEKDVVWKNNSVLLKKWKTGNLDEKWHDLNESMIKLFKDGWIHHLRRHLVADSLTRGKLYLNWREGEKWFRFTLLDHDAAVNRANWMWLSAVAFSSKQKVYHYSPEDYVKRHSKSSQPILIK